MMSAGRRIVPLMASRPLSPDTLLGVKLSAIMSRNRFTHDPAPVLAELQRVAGGRDDILTDEAGRWIGFYEDEYTRDLATALRTLPLDLDEAIALGQLRRHEGHGMKNYVAPAGVDALPTTGLL